MFGRKFHREIAAFALAGALASAGLWSTVWHQAARLLGVSEGVSVHEPFEIKRGAEIDPDNLNTQGCGQQGGPGCGRGEGNGGSGNGGNGGNGGGQ